MTIDDEPQFQIWKRYEKFRKLGMKESYLILYNGWLLMDDVLTITKEVYFNEYYLTGDFLE